MGYNEHLWKEKIDQEKVESKGRENRSRKGAVF